MYRLLKRVVLTAVTGLALVAALLMAWTNPEPWSPTEVRRLTIGLNEAAAIGVPHGFLMAKSARESHLALLQKVEAGELLSESESRQYRQVFQKVLHDSQSFLAAFDAQLTILDNVDMASPNNVTTQGISGHHDHHDVSARANFAAMLHSLEGLDQAGNPISRIGYANAVQKDLVDLISHMGVAPHTVSVPYTPPDSPWADNELGGKFEAMTKAFKDAQFAPVNSEPYWAAVDAALANYADLILLVQARVVSRTATWERRVAGRFLSTQTGAPPVDIQRPLRRK